MMSTYSRGPKPYFKGTLWGQNKGLFCSGFPHLHNIVYFSVSQFQWIPAFTQYCVLDIFIHNYYN